MKTLVRLFILVGAMSIASSAFAALNMYVKVIGPKGSSRVVLCPDGDCTLTDLAAGEYTITACLEDGSALPAAEAARHTVRSPRDTTSGMATGKRQHGEVKIVKEWSASSPMLRIAIDQPGVPVNLKITKSRSNIQNN